MTGRHRRRTLALLLPLLLAAACATGGEGARTTDWPPPGALWVESFDLRTDEAVWADSRALEIQPVEIGVQSATLLTRMGGITRTIELDTTGPLRTENLGPYAIRLIQTSAEPSATIEVAKLR